MPIMKCPQVNVCVYLLVCAFGLGSWLAVNGLFVELPLLVEELPEGWGLPSYLAVIVQLANVGPILVTLITTLCHTGHRTQLIFGSGIYVVGIVACILLSVFWAYTTVILEEERSTALFILAFFSRSYECYNKCGLPTIYGSI